MAGGSASADYVGGEPPPDRVLVLALLQSEICVGESLSQAWDPVTPQCADPLAGAKDLRADHAGSAQPELCRCGGRFTARRTPSARCLTARPTSARRHP
ncbi:hypothetical protein OG698_00745 [Streptomyces sp. NBC_01003]|uniref:hypothetical protein n=1 Tax=Streptomyces sp. NBC_01003 TaxID=2903714 RepID=UPI00386DB11C|nr:hypothetical protein OG698_00745 [Streptomyces sp. NBC_01003]